MIRATEPSDLDPMSLAPLSARHVEVLRDALIRMRDGEDLASGDLDAATELLRKVQTSNGDPLAAELMPLFTEVIHGDDAGTHTGIQAAHIGLDVTIATPTFYGQSQTTADQLSPIY